MRGHQVWARLSGVLLAGVLAACRSAAPPPPGADTLPSIPFEKYVLGNGLEVILSEDHRLPLVAVDVWYHVGAVNEVAGRTGFAHLFEHMMFQGSKHVPNDSHFKFVEQAGGTNYNGTTSFDRTNYFETLPADQLELGLWLESDRMGYLLDTVDQLKLDNQQRVVRDERRQTHESEPYAIVDEVLFHQLFPKDHPYYADVIGSHADIQAAKLDDVKAFFKQYYRPNNASVTIAGDFDKTATKALIEKYFGPLKRGVDVPKVTIPPPVITAERRVTVKDRVRLSRVYMAWISPAFFKPGDADADAASTILGGGNSSRLYKKLVYDKQIAQDVSAYQQSLAQGSVFEIVATVRPNHTPEEVEAALNEELAAFRQNGPDVKEVERARNTFETSNVRALEVLGGFGGVADTLSEFNHYLGDPGYLGQYITLHRKVTPDSVKAFAQQFLKPEARVVIDCVPGPPDRDAPVPTPPKPKVAPGTGAEAVNADEAWRATPPKGGPAHAMNLPTPASFKLANGLTVIYQTRPGTAISAASVVLKTGGDTNPIDRTGLANFTAAMIDQGTTSRDALKLADDIAQIGAALDASSSKDSMFVSVVSLTRNFSAALDLLSDVTLHPSFPQADVDRQRASRQAQLMAAKQDPSTQASMAALAALYGPLHPYGYIELGLPAAVSATTRDDLVNFWTHNFVPANAALVVVGPLGEAEVKPLVEKAFGPWPAGQVVQPALGAPRTTDARLVIVDMPGSPQTQLLVSAIGAARSTPDYADASTMNAGFGGLFSSRINLNLREAHEYTYGAASQFIFRKSAGPFWISASVNTDATAPAVSEIFKEMKRMADAPMTAEELSMSKDSIVRSLPSDFESSDSTVSTLGGLFVYDLGLDYYTKLPGAIGAVTGPSALAAAKKYLDPTKMIVIAVGDRAKIEPGLKALHLGKEEVQPQR